MDWNGKPYHSLDYELKKQFGQKVYKLSLNGGMTCPGRDGTLGSGPCIFCSAGGSGDFAAPVMDSVHEQIEAAKLQVQRKMSGPGSYIAYFQSYTNTYAPLSHLRAIFTDAIRHPDIAALSVATRPDCLGPEVVDLLRELNSIKPVWVELGLQTIHESTACFIRRGYPLPVFESALLRLKEAGITVIVHVILGLPGETREMMLETVRYLAKGVVDGIKLQLLHILNGTDLARIYRDTPFPVLSMEEYLDLVIDCVELLPPDMTIHRITGDGPKKLLVSPLWSGNKRLVLNSLHRRFKERDTWQGKHFPL
ncbi:TIGR01212 family radical SAM protein [Lachnoclostridium pacaense]|uniref:TIGR01212 family radical SAM protein n=1 Tax=Enterocloster hominis (ex Hitch et al. 2024) TaxID=1917870 RepID=UPI001D0FB4C6|nr:TIGR01212 family radical SAM protein [Lachnoclostridium pacaense]MCC2877668.1 TIGR01212 family radical SAM protein [Lachnoclostridium pacaense]